MTEQEPNIASTSLTSALAGLSDTAMVLAAGLGTRMRPLTDDRPKPLLEVGGRAMLDWALDHACALGLRRAIVNTHYCAEQIAAHCAARQEADKTAGRKRIEIILSHEEERLETGGGIKKALLHFGGKPFFVLSADLPWMENIAALFQNGGGFDTKAFPSPLAGEGGECREAAGAGRGGERLGAYDRVLCGPQTCSPSGTPPLLTSPAREEEQERDCPSTRPFGRRAKKDTRDDDTALARMARFWDPARMDHLLMVVETSKAHGCGPAGDYCRAEDGRLWRKETTPPRPYVFFAAQIVKPASYEAVSETVFSNNLIFDRAEDAGRLYGLPHEGGCYHVGTPEDWAEANRRLETGQGWE